MQRRSFLQAGLLAGSAAVLTRGRSLAATADAHVEILLDEPIGAIAPGIYGHFTEHLGGVIYDGVWVGEGSSIPNVHGVRKELVDRLRAIKAPVIRWPGGCFADSYDWRDGVGPRDKRPRRTNFWVDDPEAKKLAGNAAQLYETNAFGTDEFVRFCRLSGAEPYFAANVRSLTPLDFDHWVEYCNSPAGSTTLADLRASGGSTEPHNVRYWGIGNESWGCGGNFYPEDYATEFRRFTTWVPSYGVDLKFIGSGPNGNDLDWTRSFFHKLVSDRPDFDSHFFGWSCHYYTWNMARGKTDDWVAAKGDALDFDTAGWYELFRQGMTMEQIVTDQWAVLGEFDPQHRVKLVVDEYGPWYRHGTAVDPSHMYGQQITMRDAVHTALNLDIFNRHAEKVGMAACAQLVNCLNALFLTHEDKLTVTPNYHVFDLYAAHQGAQAVRAVFSAPEIQYQRDAKPAQFSGLSGSASVAGKTVTITVTNPSIDTVRETEILVRGGMASAASARILAAHDVHAHNTLDHEEIAAPRQMSLQINSGAIAIQLPPASVTSVTIDLG